MEISLAVSGPGHDGTGGASSDLRRWLRRDPQLRDRVAQGSATVPEPGSMGASGELVTLLLAPGGLTAALAAAVVAWLQNRRGNQTVTITLPDGTQVTVSSERVRDLNAAASGELAERVAQALERRPATTTDGDTRTDPAGDGRTDRGRDPRTDPDPAGGRPEPDRTT
ncbi:effector-associated constant component EACC1 [Streptomyces niveus]|uniref:effector-associated constant component EACC1 n=1 Tax=Streptomyces niveus TaxID=193462 RepID=UPI003431EA13